MAEPRGKESVLADRGHGEGTRLGASGERAGVTAGEMAGGCNGTSHKSGLDKRMDHFRSEHWTRRSCRPRPGIARPLRQAMAGRGMERLLHRSIHLCPVPRRPLDLSGHPHPSLETSTLATARESHGEIPWDCRSPARRKKSSSPGRLSKRDGSRPKPRGTPWRPRKRRDSRSSITCTVRSADSSSIRSSTRA